MPLSPQGDVPHITGFLNRDGLIQTEDRQRPNHPPT